MQILDYLYIDGDNFKEINDQFGHDMGDRFLKHFAEKLDAKCSHISLKYIVLVEMNLSL